MERAIKERTGGEVITEVNGVSIDSAEESRQVMAELSQNDTWTVVVDSQNGPRTVTIGLSEE